MQTKTWKIALLCLVAVALAQVAAAYTFIFDDETHQPVRWRPTTVPMLVRAGTAPTSQDGNRNNTVLAAIGIWNANLGTIQFVGTVDGGTTGTDNDHVNQIFFATDVYGDSFGDATLAITTDWSYPNNSRSEADIVFNSNSTIIIGGTSYPLSWDSYRGAQQGTKFDIRRVVLHELGHVLGLDHPDEAGQSVTAVMNSAVSEIETLAADDIAGAQHIYGVPGGAAPANDNFANATLITESDGRAYSGSNIFPNAASRQAGEPQIVGNQGGRSVWWKWVAPATATATIDTRGSYFDTTVGVYTGSAVNALTLVVDNDDENSNPPPAHIPTSLVTFNAVAGTTYYIAVDGFYHFYSAGALYNILPDSGDITLHLSQASGNVAPTISNPAGTIVNTGVTAQFSVTATGVPTPSLQWQRLPYGTGTWSNVVNADNFSGANSTTLTITGTPFLMNGDQFRCVATNVVSSATSAAAVLTVTVATSDINGDGKSDILWENTTTGDRGFYLMNGTTFTSWVVLATIAVDWRIVAAADFNADGKSDILWENTVTGDRVIWLMNGTGFVSAVALGTVGIEWRIAAVGDFNGDGKPDLVWENTVTGDRGFWIMNGTNFVSWVDAGIVSTDWRIAGVGDFNGDGKTDVLWSNTATGDCGCWIMNGTGYSSWQAIGTMMTDWRIAGVGDFNADGKPDLLWENTVSGLRYFWLMNGTGISSAVSLGVVSTDWRIAN